jgi:hypothetical protein
MLAMLLTAALDDGAKKGLQVQMLDDAVALGVRHAAINVQMGDFLTARESGTGDVPVPDTGLHLRKEALEGLDAMVGGLSRAGMRVYVILLARQSGNAAIDAKILHEKFDPQSPNKLSAFRLDPVGRETLAGFCRTLAQRYRPQSPQGTISGWIVGNEVNSHHAWFSMGRASGPEVADAVERSLRIVHDAVSPRGGQVYLSLDHFWTHRHEPQAPDHSLAGREVLDRVAELSRSRGDFPWHVAHHPYPENLFEPRFWLDATAPLAFDAPRVTFKNLEVLTEYLKQPALLHDGQPRRVILSEQGFHRPEGESGETIQAAAYAYAWNRVKRNEGIDAFILHRHTDHAHEGGLRLGLWTNLPGSVADPDRRTRMWHVFRAAGTADEASSTADLLPLVGLEDWGQTAPRPVSK